MMAQLQYAHCKTSDLTLGKHVYRSMYIGSIHNAPHNLCIFMTFITHVDKYPVSSDGEMKMELCMHSKVRILLLITIM